MDVKKLLNASEAAIFLGVHRPLFYKIMEQFNLKPSMQTGRIKLYAIAELKKIKRAI